MRIIVVGLGQAGSEIAKELIKIGHDITVIDINKNVLETFTDEYDANGVVGNGVSRKIQLQAKVNTADILIALTSSDEVNLLSCITAKALGVKHTIARINAGEYREDEKYLMDSFKIDMIINAECDMADEITRLITYPTLLKTGAFANGKVDMVEIKVKSSSMLDNLKIIDLRNRFNTNIIVSSIIRNGKLIIPRGDSIIEQNDEICITGKRSDIYTFLHKLNLIEKTVKSVFIVGCGNIGRYLLKNLSETKLKIKVIEFDKERCIKLMNEFPNAEIIHGNGIDSDMLLEEGIKNYDACISLTGADETNLVVTLFAWSCKIRKLITKITSASYTKMLHGEEIDNTLSPHLVVVSSVHRFIRGISDTNNQSSSVKSLYRVAQNMAEAIEFEITDSFKGIGKSIKEMSMHKDTLVVFLIRNGEVIIPIGDTRFEKADRVIIVANANKNVSRIEEILD